MDPDKDEKDYPIVLAKNVKGLEMQFWDSNKNPPEWVDEWEGPKTNQLPKMIMLTLKLADNPHSSRITEEITRIISLPAMTVQPVWQVPRAGRHGARHARSGRPWESRACCPIRLPAPPRMTRPHEDHPGSSHRPAAAITHRASRCTAHVLASLTTHDSLFPAFDFGFQPSFG